MPATFAGSICTMYNPGIIRNKNIKFGTFLWPTYMLIRRHCILSTLNGQSHNFRCQIWHLITIITFYCVMLMTWHFYDVALISSSTYLYATYFYFLIESPTAERSGISIIGKLVSLL